MVCTRYIIHMNPNCDIYWQLLQNLCINTDQLNFRKCLFRFKVLEMSHHHNNNNNNNDNNYIYMQEDDYESIPTTSLQISAGHQTFVRQI